MIFAFASLAFDIWHDDFETKPADTDTERKRLCEKKKRKTGWKNWRLRNIIINRSRFELKIVGFNEQVHRTWHFKTENSVFLVVFR